MDHLVISETRSPGGLPILKFLGDLDMWEYNLREFEADLAGRGRYRIAVDLSELDFLTSGGLGILVGLHKRSRRRGGLLALIIPGDSTRIYKMFQISGLLGVFPILSSTEELDSWERTATAATLQEAEFSGNWLPVRLHSQVAGAAYIAKALGPLIRSFGFDYVHSFPGERTSGSFSIESITHVRESGEKARRLADLERVLEERLALTGWAKWAAWAKRRERPSQVETDEVRSNRAGRLLAELDRTGQAVVQIGSVVLVKVDAAILVRNLDEAELARYERDPALFKDPANAMRFLQRAAAEDAEFTFGTGVRLPHQRPAFQLLAARPLSTMPVTIYVSEEAVHDRVEAEVDALLATAGLEIDDRDEPVLGSWYRRMHARAKRAAASPLVRDAALTAAHAADAKLVLGMDAEIAARFMENLGPLIVSLQPTKDAVIRLGAVLLLKVDWVVTVHQLTPAQQFTLDHQPNLPTAPHELIAAIRLKPQDPMVVGDGVQNGIEPPSARTGVVA